LSSVYVPCGHNRDNLIFQLIFLNSPRIKGGCFFYDIDLPATVWYKAFPVYVPLFKVKVFIIEHGYHLWYKVRFPFA